MPSTAPFFRAFRIGRAGSSLGFAVLATLPLAAFTQAVPPAPQVVAPSATASAPRSAGEQPRLVPNKLAASHNKALVATAGPSWAELTPAQQQSLKPLASYWNTVSEAQKRKWLEISKNYATLAPDDQATLHSRMTEWVALSPQQRAQARLNFAKTKELSQQLTPDEKKEKWQAYQALSPEEKARLAQKAPPRPAGAATAVRPVAVQKLANVHQHPAAAASSARPAGSAAPKIEASPAAVPQVTVTPPQPTQPAAAKSP